MPVKRICLFCGANCGANPAYAQAARAVAHAAVKAGLGVVYGGGRVGLMGAIANAVLEEKGSVIGVIPHALVEKELAHHGVTELRVVHSMHERKWLMAELSDAFIALPGGYGTLEEFCEVLTWAQLGLHVKPLGLLNVNGFYDSFLAHIDRAIAERFVPVENRSLFHVDDHPARLVEKLLNEHPLPARQWVSADDV